MRFTIQSMVAMATGLLPLANLALADDCTYNSDFMQAITYQNDVDSAGGGYFCGGKWSSGLIITGIEAWGDGHRLTGIKFRFSDNTWGDLHGTTYGDSQKVTWDPSEETVESFHIMGPYHEDGVGRIKLTTSGGTSYNFGGDTGSYEGTDVEVGAGIILAATGSCGDWLDNLGLIFLSNKIESVNVIDITYDEDLATMNSEQTGLSNSTLEVVYFQNPDGAERDYEFTPSISKENTNGFTQSSQTTWGVSVGVTLSVGVPEVASASIETSASWETSQTSQSDWSLSTDAGLTWSLSGTLNDTTSVCCQSTSMSGTFSSGYTSTVRADLTTGKSFTYTETGTFQGTSWAQAVAWCSRIDSIPDGATVTEGSLVSRSMEERTVKGRPVKFFA